MGAACMREQSKEEPVFTGKPRGASETKYLKCQEYVRKAIESGAVKAEDSRGLAAALCEVPGKELTFTYEIKYDDSKWESENPNTIHDETDYKREPSTIDLETEARRTAWPRDKRRETEYKLPDDKFTCVKEVEIDVTTKKRRIYAMSDLHLGGSWAEGMNEKLELYLNSIIEIAQEKLSPKTALPHAEEPGHLAMLRGSVYSIPFLMVILFMKALC